MLLALELRPDAALAHALDDAGALLYSSRRALSASLSATQRWLELIETARQTCALLALEPAQFARVALVFCGALDGDGRVLADAQAGAPGFARYDLRRGLREHLQLGDNLGATEIIVASECVADAWAQHQAGVTRGFDGWIYLSIGEQLESLACARGAWIRSDLGGLVLQRDGALDHRARQGTLSAYCAGLSFAERARSYSLNVAAPEIWTLSQSNFAAQSLARDYVSRLAQGLASAIAALSPQRICIGGALGRAIFARIHSDLASELRDTLRHDAWNGDIVLSAAGERDISAGALALATLGAPPL